MPNPRSPFAMLENNLINYDITSEDELEDLMADGASSKSGSDDDSNDDSDDDSLSSQKSFIVSEGHFSDNDEN